MDTNQDVQQTLVGGAMAPIHAEAVEQELEGIATIQKHVRMQKVSPVEVVIACLKRIEQLNPELNAFITVLADQALEQARVAEAEIKAAKWRGPLHGIPVGIKDSYDTAGIKTTAGFDRFKDRVPGKDAVGVAKLKEAGAIIIGKMNMHRLGMGTTGIDSYYGPVRNPWNAEYIPGGSSAGSAAAVATGMCYATLDTDAIGSCRLPAACCGVVGFKGTYGLINPKGILEGEQDPAANHDVHSSGDSRRRCQPQALSPKNTVFANYYGLPAMSIPSGFDSNGLPLGLQMVGKPWDEATVLCLEYRYETTTSWRTKHPAA